MTSRSTIGLLVLSVILWGANFNLSQPALAEMHPLEVAAARFVIAALIIVSWAAFKGQRVPLLRYAKSYVPLGVVGVAGFNILFFYGMQSTSPVNGSLIQATNPLVTSLLAAAFLGERPSMRQMVAFPVALAGVGFVLLGGGASLVLSPGDSLVMAANTCWAIYNVLARKLMPPVSGIANTGGIMVVGAVTLCAAAMIVDVPMVMPGPKGAAAVLTMAVCGGVLAYMLYNTALSRLGAGKTALFINLVPVVAMVISALTGNPPTWIQVAGGLVTIGAVTMAMLPGREKAAV